MMRTERFVVGRKNIGDVGRHVEFDGGVSSVKHHAKV